MTKISHEIPKQLFPKHDDINDYPYVLAHLLLEETHHYDKDYAEFYEAHLKEKEFSILDNSLYELGDSIDYSRLFELGQIYKPSHIIVPDCFNDMHTTRARVLTYIEEYGVTSIPKLAGVTHGITLGEIDEILDFYIKEPKIDLICVPFAVMSGCIPQMREEDRKLWRVRIMRDIVFPALRRNNSKKKIHLLGCYSVFEFNEYTKEEWEMIYSVDTSAPIVYGWERISFENCNLSTPKPQSKLAESLGIVLDEVQLKVIGENVEFFKKMIP